ncbi:MAG: ABC1 kinase family protein [Pseudomonadota bacterium]
MHVAIRLVQINRALWGLLLWWGLVRIGLIRPRTAPAQRFAATLERLGTTFVKLGQGLSLHRELLPDDYVAALQKLHDRVEPFPFEQARAEVEASFGRPLGELFARFEPQAMAAGSIAQVHRAALPDGRAVIVKVRRPGIRRQVDEDIRILRWFVKSVLWLLPALRAVQPLEIVDELARNLHREIDFRQEAHNIARFTEMFQGSPTVYVPGVVGELYTEWVIVQELSPGRRIDDAAFLPQGPRLAANLVEAYLRQFFVEGVFHGDPHPGNLFVLEDGRICLHDFGLVGFLDRRTRMGLVAFMLAFVQQDGDWLVDAYLDLGMLGGRLDREEFRAGMEEVVQDYARKPLKDWSFGEAFLRIARMGHGRNVRLPHHLLVLLRAVFLMESTVRRLDPRFNLMEGLFAKAGELLETAGGAGDPAARFKYEAFVSLRQLPSDLSQALHRVRSRGIELSVAHHGLDPLQEEIGRSSRRVALALVTLGLYIAASLLMQHSLGPRWGEVPVLAGLGYVLALWLSWRLVREIGKAG